MRHYNHVWYLGVSCCRVVITIGCNKIYPGAVRRIAYDKFRPPMSCEKWTSVFVINEETHAFRTLWVIIIKFYYDTRIVFCCFPNEDTF